MNFPRPKKINAEKYVAGLSLFKQKVAKIKLSANESALGPSPKAIKEFNKVAKNLKRYPDSDGIFLRQILAKKFRLDPKRIILGSGSDQIFELICKAFLNKNDEVVVPEFSFIIYRIYSKIYGAKIKYAKEKNFKISINNILSKVTKKTKIVFLANPNNPTGTIISKKELLRLRRKLRSNILLVVDDAYFEFMNQDDFISGLELFKDEPNVMITRTFSKIYGLAGLRVGWGYSSKEIIDAMYQIKPPFNVNSAALSASSEAINDNEWTLKAIEHNTFWTKKIYDVLEKNNVVINKPSANFFLMNFDKTKISSDEAFDKLANERLILRKMSQYKIPNCLRLTIGNNQENEHFIKTINNILK